MILKLRLSSHRCEDRWLLNMLRRTKHLHLTLSFDNDNPNTRNTCIYIDKVLNFDFHFYFNIQFEQNCKTKRVIKGQILFLYEKIQK